MTDEKSNHFIISALEAFLNKLTGSVNVVLGLLLLAMGLILGANIVLRYVFESPISWSNVITRYAYIYIVLLGTAISYIEGSHAQIDFVYEKVSHRMKAVFDLCHYLIMLFLCTILIIYGIKHVITMWPVHSPVVKIVSMGAVYLSIPISAVIMLVFLIKKILNLRFR